MPTAAARKRRRASIRVPHGPRAPRQLENAPWREAKSPTQPHPPQDRSTTTDTRTQPQSITEVWSNVGICLRQPPGMPPHPAHPLVDDCGGQNWRDGQPLVGGCPATPLPSAMGVRAGRPCARALLTPAAGQGNTHPGVEEQANILTKMRQRAPARHPAAPPPHRSCGTDPWSAQPT